MIVLMFTWSPQKEAMQVRQDLNAVLGQTSQRTAAHSAGWDLYVRNVDIILNNHLTVAIKHYQHSANCFPYITHRILEARQDKLK